MTSQTGRLYGCSATSICLTVRSIATNSYLIRAQDKITCGNSSSPSPPCCPYRIEHLIKKNAPQLAGRFKQRRLSTSVRRCCRFAPMSRAPSVDEIVEDQIKERFSADVLPRILSVLSSKFSF